MGQFNSWAREKRGEVLAANDCSQQGQSTTSWELARTLREQKEPESTKTHWYHWDAGKQPRHSGIFNASHIQPLRTRQSKVKSDRASTDRANPLIHPKP